MSKEIKVNNNIEIVDNDVEIVLECENILCKIEDVVDNKYILSSNMFNDNLYVKRNIYIILEELYNLPKDGYILLKDVVLSYSDINEITIFDKQISENIVIGNIDLLEVKSYKFKEFIENQIVVNIPIREKYADTQRMLSNKMILENKGEDNMSKYIKVNTEKYGAYGTIPNNKNYNILLTKEELEKINKSLGEISEINKLRSLCCHRDEDNKLTIEATDDDKIKCKVCSKEFEMFNLSDSKNVNDTIDKFISLMETVKLSYVDIPDNLKEYFTFLSYDSKEICRKALESYDNFHKNNNHFKKINTYSVKPELLN